MNFEVLDRSYDLGTSHVTFLKFWNFANICHRQDFYKISLKFL